jgi:hypothetical protein
MAPTRRPTCTESGTDAHRVRSVQLHRAHGSPRRSRPNGDPPWHWALGLTLAMLLVLALGAWIDELDADQAAPAAAAAACSAHPDRNDSKGTCT